MVSKFVVLCSVLLINGAISEVSETSRDEQTVGKDDSFKIPKLTGNDLPTNIQSLPSVRQGEIAFQDMCIKNGGNESFEKAQTALKNVRSCFSEIIHYAELPAEIQKKRPTGELDTVFKNYCERSDELKGCVVKFLVDIEPCLPEGQKSTKYTLQNITEVVLKFVCENEGDHIALFISEKGPECILSKQSGIEQCIKSGLNDSKINETYEDWANQMSSENFTNISNEQDQSISLSFELEQCKKAYSIRNCIIQQLSTCSGSTPANVIESVFNLVQNSTTCRQFTVAQLDPNYKNTASMYQNMLSVIVPALTILFVRNYR